MSKNYKRIEATVKEESAAPYMPNCIQVKQKFETTCHPVQKYPRLLDCKHLTPSRSYSR